MKAVVMTAFGGPEVLRVEDVVDAHRALGERRTVGSVVLRT